MEAQGEAEWELLLSRLSHSPTAVSIGRSFIIWFLLINDMEIKSYDDLEITKGMLIDHHKAENNDVLSCQYVEDNGDYGVMVMITTMIFFLSVS